MEGLFEGFSFAFLKSIFIDLRRGVSIKLVPIGLVKCIWKMKK